MMPAAKHLDPIVGVDVHMIQPPGPVPPVPIPHPFIGMIIDPADYVPIIGATVMVNGMPRAQAGTAGKDIPPHIPIGGVFVKPPANECEMFMGSATVSVDGDAFSHMVHPTLSCQCIGMPTPPRQKASKVKSLVLPTSVVLPIPAGPPVLVGGPPTISLMALGMKVGMAALGKGLKKLMKSKLAKRAGKALKAAKKKACKKMKPGVLKCKILKAEPVNSITGEVVVEQQDFSIPGLIPFDWSRSYGSQSEYSGSCGNGWQTPADIRLEIESDDTVSFYDGGPGATIFPGLPENDPVTELIDGAVLQRDDKSFFVRNKGGIVFRFTKANEKPPGEANKVRRFYIDRIEDAFGNYLGFVRNERGELTRIQEKAGRYIEVTSTDGLIRKLAFVHPEQPAPKPLLRYEYDNQNNLIAVFDALGNPYRFAYKDSVLNQHTNRNGLSFFYEYDQNTRAGKCIHAWGDGGLYDYRFKYAEGETSITNSLGNKTTIVFDANNLPLKEIDEIGDLASYEYDDVGRTSAVIDGAGNRTEYEYDDFGNLLKLTRPDGTVVLTDFDEKHNPIKVTDPMGHAWGQEWNADGLLTKQVSPNGGITQYEYDDKGQLLCVISPNGGRSTIEFDSYGSVNSFVDPLGNRSHFEIDLLGNTTKEIGPTQRAVSYRYDAKSRLIHVTNPSGTKVACAYDAEDNLTRYRDEAGHITQMEYAGLGEVAKRIQPDGTVVQYKRDTEEQLLGVVNERGQEYKFDRDSRGRIVKEIDYWSNARKYEYDIAGHITRSEDALGRVTDFETDKLGRLQTKAFASGKKESFEYDANGNLIAHENEHTRCERIFDAEDQLLEETQGDFKVSYRYDLNNNRIERTSSHGNSIQYEFDAADLVAAVKINNQQSVKIQKDADGYIVKEILSGRIERDYEYTLDGRMAHQRVYTQSANLVNREYTYDPTGNLTSKRDSNKGVTSFAYNPLGQIIKSINPQKQIKEYLYDPAGDLLKSSHPAGKGAKARKATYDGIECSFDVAGNLIERNGNGKRIEFEWNDNNQLARAVNESGRATSMAYDAQGRRMFKETDGRKICFAWDGDSLLSDVSEKDGPREFVFYPGSSEPLACISSKNEIFYYQNDLIGLPQEVTNEQGQIVWSATYGDFGAVEALHQSQIDNPLRFQGQYYDEEIDLSYNRFRFYDSQTGTFASMDPLGLNAGHNVYQYAPNVWTWVDPLGLTCDGAGADKWSRSPKSLQDQMALDQARKGAGQKIIDNLGDPKFKGMEKWEYRVKSANKKDSVVHYVRDPKTGELKDFKFKKHSTEDRGAWESTQDPKVPPGG